MELKYILIAYHSKQERFFIVSHFHTSLIFAVKPEGANPSGAPYGGPTLLELTTVFKKFNEQLIFKTNWSYFNIITHVD